jgi:hypothetical protein
MITKKDRIATGALDYFPNALAAIGRWSAYNNAKYPPAEPPPDGSPRWSFDVSTEHADAIASHLAQRGVVDEAGFSHSVPLAWRALALLETELVNAGAKPGGAVVRSPKPERWGIFDHRGNIEHGFLTVLSSEQDAKTCCHYRPQNGHRVARIECVGGRWQEVK